MLPCTCSMFFELTYHQYRVIRCYYDGKDCRNMWVLVGTLMGKCLKLDLNLHTNITSKGRYTLNPISNHSMLQGIEALILFRILLSLSVSFAMNDSDVTSGWNSRSDGLSIYPTHKMDYDFVLEDHSSPIEHKMIPAITLQNQKRIYAGTSTIYYNYI